MKFKTFFLALILLAGMSAAFAQEALAPVEIPGEVVYVPFSVNIVLDGASDDWAGVPTVTVDRGPAPSPDPAENGSFTFAVAADENNFYIMMTMPDKNIIAGQHGTDFWNEDSLEFYLNLSDDLDRTQYGDGVYQININASDIGNSDPAAITLTGTNATQSGVQAVVFETDDGWGFEAAVPLPFEPEHGTEIGFQAQANGAAEQDRNVKLIWSNLDASDQSWQNPSLFGRAVFFEIGRTDIPEAMERSVAVEPTQAAPSRLVSVNQVGYLTNAAKYGMIVGTGNQRTVWWLVNVETGENAAAGTTTAGKLDEASGDIVQIADFSKVTTPGLYTLVIDDVQSVPFQISNDLYSQLKVDALRYFYLNRSGIELDEQHAGDWARPAGHLSDDAVMCYKGRDAEGTTWDGCDYTLNARGGWYDAGDYGKYVVNGGIATWTLQNLYERLPEAFDDDTLNIPESRNGVPDILDEARWEMEFLLAMQVPEGQPQAGMAHHKLHDEQWAGMPVLPPTTFDNLAPRRGRALMPPSTTATLNLAAAAAQCARIWKEIDAAFSERCLTAAEAAWKAANENPVFLYGNIPGNGGGNYGDNNAQDDFYWAAAELFVTTQKDEYGESVRDSRYFTRLPGTGPNDAAPMTWGTTAALGTITLATQPSGLTDDERATLQQQIVVVADRYLDIMNDEGYRVSLRPTVYHWGSNSDVLNNGIILALAYDFTQDTRYLNGAAESMDYLLGRNALAFSFVAGYGTNAMQHPHHRFWANQPAQGFPPPPPGALAGGPNGQPSDEAALNAGVMQLGAAKRYVDLIGSFSTNEVAINWNAPLVWLSAYLDSRGSAQ